MKNLLICFALLLAAIPAAAQTSLAAARPDLPVATQAAPDTAAAVLSTTAPDTAAAIHRLFVSKRRVLRYVALGTFLAAATAITIVANTYEGFIDTRGPAALGIGLISGAVLLGEANSYAGWSRKKEHRALEDWQQHRLSAFYHRKLKPKYFR